MLAVRAETRAILDQDERLVVPHELAAHLEHRPVRIYCALLVELLMMRAELTMTIVLPRIDTAICHLDVPQ